MVAKSKMEITKEHIDDALENTSWDFLNKQLYELCEENPDHKSIDTILAKIVLIGRTYSAALERRKPKDEKDKTDSKCTLILGQHSLFKGDLFLQNAARIIQNSPIDTWLRELRFAKVEMIQSLEKHKCLVCLFWNISGQEKRSLASKYLHFHLPEHFYIFDSRAEAALNALVKNSDHQNISAIDVDTKYSKHWHKCEQIKQSVTNLTGKVPSTRDVDKILLHIASLL